MARKSKTPESSSPKIPRSRNAWIIYRSQQLQKLHSAEPGLHPTQQAVSRMLVVQWQNLPEESKGEYYKQAVLEKVQHEQRYPDYRFKPKRRQVNQNAGM
jgi:HMG box factor